LAKLYQEQQREEIMPTIEFYVLENHVEWRNEIGLHRENSHPAIMYDDGTKGWFLNDQYVPSEELKNRENK
jgi:hypothetical protein